MRKKTFKVLRIALYIGMGVVTGLCLFYMMVTGAPEDAALLGKYLICAAALSVVIPAFLCISCIRSEYLDVPETSESIQEIPEDDSVLKLVSAFAEKKKLTDEEKEDLLKYLQDL